MEYELDGRFNSLEEFYAEIGRVLVGNQPWGENLDALDDLLHNHPGLPDKIRIVWRHADCSRAQLSYTETVRQLLLQLRDCQPTVLIKTAWALRAALRGQGPTVFDWLVALLSKHPNVELLLVEGATFEEIDSEDLSCPKLF